jgi:hypothetical protein
MCFVPGALSFGTSIVPLVDLGDVEAGRTRTVDPALGGDP